MRTYSKYPVLKVSDVIKKPINLDKVNFTISYEWNNEKVKYKVDMISMNSNLGKGKVWYFICPHTKRKCRKLYLVHKYYLHREAYKNIYYYSQTLTPKNRIYDSFHRGNKAQEIIDSKGFKKYYNNKPTKKYLKLIKKVERANRSLGVIDSYISQLKLKRAPRK